MDDIFTSSHVEEQLALIKDILEQFGLAEKVEVTFVNGSKTYCNEGHKHFFGFYDDGERKVLCAFNWYRTGCSDPDWVVKGAGAMWKYDLRYPWLGLEESRGNMVYVGGD